MGVAADTDEQRAHVGLGFPEGYAFPMRGLPASHLDRLLAASLDGRRVKDPVTLGEVELRLVGTPQARNSVPDPGYDGGRGYVPRGAQGRPDSASRCVGNATCIPHCPSYAKYTPLKTQGQWGSSVTLVDQAVVSRVLVDGNGRATGVEYLSYDGQATRVHAVVVVLAAHAIENARLLLLSRLATRSGQVGRNLMDHPVLLTWGLMPEAVDPYRGPGSTSGFEGFRAGPERRARAPFRIEVGNWGWVWAKGSVDGDVAQLLHEKGRERRDLVRRVLTRSEGPGFRQWRWVRLRLPVGFRPIGLICSRSPARPLARSPARPLARSPARMRSVPA